MRRAIVVTMLASLSVIGGGWEANACSCASIGPAAALKRADVAFAGLVTAVRDGPTTADPRTVTVDVSGVYKGTVDQITYVETPRTGGDCGIDFVPSRRYTVFAQREGSKLISQICDATAADAALLEGVATARPVAAKPAAPATKDDGGFPFLNVLVVLIGAGAITAWRRRRRSTI